MCLLMLTCEINIDLDLIFKSFLAIFTEFNERPIS